jgi:galactokinase
VSHPRDGGLVRAERRFAATFGDMARADRWWIPGRIEILGKHVDYGGGRSLLATVDRGFHVVARPRADRMVHIVDARTGARLDALLDPTLPGAPAQWTDYPRTVLRRVARDFPDARRGLDMVVSSSLPSAAGLSSSSALVIAPFLPLAAANALESTATYRAAITDADALAEYLGAVENGRAFGPFPADFGVGTQGGSQDHTAIMRCAANEIAQYRYLPTRAERRLPLPPEWAFVVASSGVHAPKAGAVQARYNALAAEVQELLTLWRTHVDPSVTSLLTLLASHAGASDEMHSLAERFGSAPRSLQQRLEQFRIECLEIIPAVADALARHAVHEIGAPVARSQHLAETVLRNQVPETITLVTHATRLGAVGASAFGAGFGGSVWALVRREAAAEFATAWRGAYLADFPAREARAEIFVTSQTPGAGPILR